MDERDAYIQMVVLHDVETGRTVAVNMMWVKTVEEMERGTLFTFIDGGIRHVEEDFDYAAATVNANYSRKRPKR